MMAAFVGAPIAEVTNVWGPPSTVYEEPPYKVYVWHSSRVRSTPVYTDPYGKVRGGMVHSTNSYRMFWVGADGRVARWKFGNQ